jgi:transitional endoplasmic reticulum ATPase
MTTGTINRTPAQLTPAQLQALERLRQSLSVGNLITLGGSGRGASTVLNCLHQETGGRLLALPDYLEAASDRHPLGMEEALRRLVLDAIREHAIVYLDDLDLLQRQIGDCKSDYPRAGYLNLVFREAAKAALAADVKLVLCGSRYYLDSAVRDPAYGWSIPRFEPEDYQCLCEAHLRPDLLEGLDLRKIHRFAPRLNARQLASACAWLNQATTLNTEQVIEYLRSQHLVSNVDLGEVQAVDLHTLKGVDDVIRSLEANIILPLENDVLAEQYDLQPKRGVLLAGPPGTGKTTIGRALAHRLKSKFFLIDGTVISGTGNFYAQVSHIFSAAEENAPSIIFIDDSDVIFESGSEHGLYRYLLTMLDGLESEQAGQVCVMMTAMDVGNLPPALLRSGRIELWLEMRLPDPEARELILREHCENLPAAIGPVDFPVVATAAEGFTGADLKRLVGDAKLLVAYDASQGGSNRPTTEYFLQAIEEVRRNKERYAQAEARAAAGRPDRPAWFAPHFGDDYSDEADEADE